ncbi:MAG: hypothetical protein HY579_08825 [Nitrospinae bacterium]|nr:hypothetical protein [Nitrospinota bacterium]
MQRGAFCKTLTAFAVLFACVFPPPSISAQTVHIAANHRIAITLFPNEGVLEARDSATFHLGKTRENSNMLSLLLHADYKIAAPLENVLGKTLVHQGWKIKFAAEKPPVSETGVPVIRIDIEKPAGVPWPASLPLEFDYKGPFYDPLRSTDRKDDAEDLPVRKGQKARKPERTEGILLSGASFFYPQTAEPPGAVPPLIDFSLTVKTPPGWEAVSQGRRKTDDPKNRKDWRTVVWTADEPQEEIFLVADRFEKYETRHGRLSLYAYLRGKNPDLANQYLHSAGAYLDFYENLLGPYPYPKFALVENSRQTGFGMASFTLLGSRIIRFPFIMKTSYPHEILHNWWGNGVFIDPSGGNWAEGLTAYLSDHLFAELDGQGEKYRFQELMKYLNYVSAGRDFPLAEFKGRHDMASQAVGYGKWLMVLHMLRTELGDGVFLDSLRRFYADNKFRFAGFKDLQSSFETVSGKKLDGFFKQWTTRAGAPELELSDASYVASNGKYSLEIAVSQKQPKPDADAPATPILPENPPFELTLPIAIWSLGKEAPDIKFVKMTGERQTFAMEVPEEPSAVMLDPYHDVFRRLDRNEVPPSVGQTYGSDKIRIVVPDEESDPRIADAYRLFANSLTEEAARDGNRIVTARDFVLDPEESVWIFGGKNEIAEVVKESLLRYEAQTDDSGIVLEGKHFPWEGHSFALTVRNPKNSENSITWVVSDSPESVPGLIRKLPHYGKYGYLVFQGTQPTNLAKGTWPTERASLMKVFQPRNGADGESPRIVPPRACAEAALPPGGCPAPSAPRWPGKFILPAKPPLVNFKPHP